jgi:hypothetical protein
MIEFPGGPAAILSGFAVSGKPAAPRSVIAAVPDAFAPDSSPIGVEGRRGRGKASSISHRNPRLEFHRQCPRCARAEASLFRPCGFTVKARASGGAQAAPRQWWYGLGRVFLGSGA